MVIKYWNFITNIIFALFILVGVINFNGAQAQLLCSNYTNADGDITFIDGSSGASTACNLTPESMTINLHFIGLCTAEPTIANFRTACSSIFTSNPGESKKITTPTLIVWGENDAIIPVECGSLFQANITNSTLKIIANCGHSPAIEKPNEFMETVNKFLSN